MQFSWGDQEETIDTAAKASAARSSYLSEGPILPVYDAGPQQPQPQNQQQEVVVPVGSPVDEVQRILDTANAYKAFLEGEFFEHPTPIALACQGRIKQLVANEIEVLLGRRPAQVAQVASPFSPEEVKALRFLAQSAMKSLASSSKASASDSKREEPAASPTVTHLPAPVPAEPAASKKRPIKERNTKKPAGPLKFKGKVEAPPSTLNVEVGTLKQPPAVAATPATPIDAPPVVHGTIDATGGVRQQERTYSQRTYPVKVLVKDEKTGEEKVVEKQIHLDTTRQVRPLGVQPAPTPVTQAQQDQVNMRADIEASNNINIFARKYAANQQ
jgi:hypothetical protein